MKLLFNICLSLLGFIAIILEFFVPSAGVIGFIGAGCVITGIVLTYTNFGLMAGTIFLIICAILGPLIIFLYFKIFPKSFIGRKLILSKKQESREGFVSGEASKYGDLIGCEGVVDTKLRPIGKILISNTLYNATTQGEFIDKGTHIKVLNVVGNRIIVSLKES